MEEKKSKEARFIDYLILNRNDTGYLSKWKHADNPNTSFMAWEVLSPWCEDLSNPYKRQPYEIVGAAFARRNKEYNGTLSLGKALYLCYPSDDNNPGKAKLRRLLSCADTIEICNSIKPILRLIDSKGVDIDYIKLLKDLTWFNEKIKINWAQDFFHGGVKNDNKSDSN
jgi:CRISPR type I-E-associated protein CasB/Cse2